MREHFAHIYANPLIILHGLLKRKFWNSHIWQRCGDFRLWVLSVFLKVTVQCGPQPTQYGKRLVFERYETDARNLCLIGQRTTYRYIHNSTIRSTINSINFSNFYAISPEFPQFHIVSTLPSRVRCWRRKTCATLVYPLRTEQFYSKMTKQRCFLFDRIHWPVFEFRLKLSVFGWMKWYSGCVENTLKGWLEIRVQDTTALITPDLYSVKILQNYENERIFALFRKYTRRLYWQANNMWKLHLIKGLGLGLRAQILMTASHYRKWFTSLEPQTLSFATNFTDSPTKHDAGLERLY